MNPTQSKIRKLVDIQAELANTRKKIKALSEYRDALRSEIANLTTDIRPGDKISYWNMALDIQKKKVYKVAEVASNLNGEPFFWVNKIKKDGPFDSELDRLPIYQGDYTLWKV